MKSMVSVAVTHPFIPCASLANSLASLVFYMDESLPRRSKLIVSRLPLLLKICDIDGLLKYSKAVISCRATCVKLVPTGLYGCLDGKLFVCNS